MQEIIYLFVIFIFYSFTGWLIETCLGVFENKKFINRGFLIGPYCPIYGLGAISLLFVLKRYNHDPLALFVIGTALCSFIEYTTSYLLEKMFKARWWDYSHIPFNINGRICLSYSVLFGFGGLFIMKFNPSLIEFLKSIPINIFNIFTIILVILFIIDFIISFKIINKIKLATLEYKKDNTEEITAKISSIIREKSNQIIRLLQAFPNAKVNIKKLKRKS